MLVGFRLSLPLTRDGQDTRTILFKVYRYYDGGVGGYSERRVRRVRPARATAMTAFQWGTRERSNEPE